MTVVSLEAMSERPTSVVSSPISLADAIAFYKAHGIAVTPVARGEKRGRLTRWSEPGHEAKDGQFKPDDNIALLNGFAPEPGTAIADVDIDITHRATATLARRILPRTGWVYGRASKPVSHFTYLTTGHLVTRQYRGTDGGMHVELRARTKKHTYSLSVAPGSVHPSGEPIRFLEPRGEIGRVDASVLATAVQHLAIAFIIVTTWPGNHRHDLRLAYAKVLYEHGLTAGPIITLLEAVMDATGSDVADVAPAVRNTIELIDKGEKTKGASAIKEALGEDTGSKVLNAFSRTLDRTQEIGLGDSSDTKAFPHTEAGDAEYFAHVHADHVRFDHRQDRWLIADSASGIWVPDQVQRATRMAVRAMRSRQRDALTMPSEEKKTAISWALKGESRSRLINMLHIAATVPPIADPGDNWDQHPFLLGVHNGVVDLHTGEFRKARPEDRITMRTRVVYDPNATCPTWEQTLLDIFTPPFDLTTEAAHREQGREMAAFMQRAIGYSITGDCREECCFFTWGLGGNGKGTVINTIAWALADYTDDLPYSTLEKSDRGGGVPNDVAKLVGKRFVTSSEVNEFRLNESKLKTLTGRDPMTARFLHKEFFTFIPVGKIWIATNTKPEIVGDDDGIWRRIYLIPFTNSFEGREKKQLKDQLRDELPGILNWMIKGTRRWLEQGLKPPPTVQAATRAYRQESSPLMPFIEARCDQREGLMMTAGEAYAEYRTFQHADPLTDKAFGKAMRRLFPVSEQAKRHVTFVGVGLRRDPVVQAIADDIFEEVPEARRLQ